MNLLAAASKSPPPDWALAVVVPASVIAWIVVGRLIRTRLGFVGQLPLDPGPVLADSGWGSAVVNGCMCRNTVRLTTHGDGWVLRNRPVFGGGRMWLPRAATVVGPVTTNWFGRRERTMTCGRTAIRLLGPMAGYG